jgi:hypothetical protein
LTESLNKVEKFVQKIPLESSNSDCTLLCRKLNEYLTEWGNNFGQTNFGKNIWTRGTIFIKVGKTSAEDIEGGAKTLANFHQ